MKIVAPFLSILGILIVLTSVSHGAAPQIFKSIEITDLISKASIRLKQKIVMDPSVRGRISIYSPEKLTDEDFRRSLMMALASNGFAIVENNGFWHVMSARDAQRSGVPVYEGLPDLKEERMITVIFRLKKANAGEVLKHLRMLPSKHGEIYSVPENDALIMTDFYSTLTKANQILQRVSTATEPATKTAQPE